MRARKAVLLLLLAIALVFSAVPIATARTLNGAITGMTLLPNGKPAAGVKIQAWQGKYNGLYGKDWEPFGSPVTTGRNGSYKITVPPGTYRVWFVPSDLETYCMEAYPNAASPYTGDDVVVRAGRTVSRVSVTLDGSPGAIEGTVFDATNGEPIEGISLRLGFQAVAIINTEFGTTTSDADGHYRFAGLKPWGWGAWSHDGRGVTPTYLDVLKFDEGAWTEPGTSTTIDFDLEPEGWVSLDGTITDESLAGVEGLTVGAMLFEQSDGYFFDYASTTTDEDGHFEFVNLPAGQWMFYAFGPGYNYRFYNGDEGWGEEIPIERGQHTTLGEWTIFPEGP